MYVYVYVLHIYVLMYAYIEVNEWQKWYKGQEGGIRIILLL